MHHVAKFWPLSDVHLGRSTPPKTFTAPSLYRLAVEAFVRSFSDNPRCNGYRVAIGQLPVTVRLDVLCEMCDCPSLIEAQLHILSDPLLFSDLIRYRSSALTPLVRCVQWLQSAKESLPAELCTRYRRLVDTKPHTDDHKRLDYRCGLRIGTFLTQTGWTVEAIAILLITRHQTRLGSPDELAVLRQLLRAQTLTGKLKDASKTYQRMEKVKRWILLLPETETGRLHDLFASVWHSFALFHFESRSFRESFECGEHALSWLGERSPSRLVVDVYRLLARASVGQRLFESAEVLLEQAIARAMRDFGRTSAPYAETLEELAMFLLARSQVGESVDVYAEAQHIYMQLYGSRNLLLSLAQGDLAYGLCLQAYVTGRRDRALQHVEQAIGNYNRILPKYHRLFVQVRRLRVTIDMLKFYTNGDTTDTPTFNYREVYEPLSVEDISSIRSVQQVPKAW
ncbi:amyloid protein-binding protein 2-like [Anopheles nili]|uniref:amyloid protein-binding protein 2-like n=1 Tax=Anopheles nili TaxID=185578 RepID=UPI00237B2D8E|nr:amyloid protein-binding protein 2-like [Anopheles nili]